ncbi:unnamed protein product, partial [Brenthis ino]
MENKSEPEIQIEYYELHETDQLCDILSINDGRSSLLNLDDNKVIFDTKEENEINTTYERNDNDLNTVSNMPCWHQSIDNDGRLLCKFCDLKYSTMETLRIHIKRKHSKDYAELKKSILHFKRNSKHVCRICKKTFILLSDLKTHVNVKHKIEVIKSSCTDCDATFNDSIELSEHMYIKHNKDANLSAFICEICGYRTMKRSHYKQHCNTHDEKKLLSCHYCDYKTNSTSNLTIHEYIHTKNKSFACDFMNCDYRCGSKAALRGHKLKHFPEKNMLFCDKCNYKTVYKHSLKKHSDSHERNCTRVK